jgi:hypothetical protein
MPQGVYSNMEEESVFNFRKDNGLTCKYKLIDFPAMK